MTEKTVVRAIVALLFSAFVVGFALGQSPGPAGHIGKDHDQLTVITEHTYAPHFRHSASTSTRCSVAALSPSAFAPASPVTTTETRRA